jgi:hypothetical protein
MRAERKTTGEAKMDLTGIVNLLVDEFIFFFKVGNR